MLLFDIVSHGTSVPLSASTATTRHHTSSNVEPVTSHPVRRFPVVVFCINRFEHTHEKQSKRLREELLGADSARAQVIEAREKLDALSKQAEGRARENEKIEAKVWKHDTILMLSFVRYLGLRTGTWYVP